MFSQQNGYMQSSEILNQGGGVATGSLGGPLSQNDTHRYRNQQVRENTH
jgi:hypothetical protein